MPNLAQLKTKLSLLQRLLALRQTTRERVHQAALNSLGTDASPNDLAPDEVGCAETVTTIIRPIFGNPVILGTYTLHDYLNSSKAFIQVVEPMPGDIVLSPTGMGNGKIVGHVGIVGNNNTIMSNDSYTGKFMANYTISNWHNRYVVAGALPMFYFRAK